MTLLQPYYTYFNVIITLSCLFVGFFFSSCTALLLFNSPSILLSRCIICPNATLPAMVTSLVSNVVTSDVDSVDSWESPIKYNKGYLWHKNMSTSLLPPFWWNIILYLCLFVCLMVFNVTFNISVVLRWSVLLVEEAWVPGENHSPVASHWQTLSHNVVSSTPCHERDSNSQLSYDQDGPCQKGQ